VITHYIRILDCNLDDGGGILIHSVFVFLLWTWISNR